MNTAAKRARIENKAKARLEAMGCDVTRAAASHGVFDLIATHPTHVRYVQVKSGKKPYVSLGELETIAEFRCPGYCSRELWRWTDRAKYPRVEVVRFHLLSYSFGLPLELFTVFAELL